MQPSAAFGLVPAIPRLANGRAVARPVRKTQHTSRALPPFGSRDGRMHGLSWAGGSGAFPTKGLARQGACVTRVFVATCIKATVPSPGCAGANRRRPRTSFSRETGPSGAACPTLLSAGRDAAACPKCGKADVRSPAPGDPDRPGTANGVPSIKVGLRGVGGGSHRLAGPVASNSVLQAVRQGRQGPLARRSSAAECPPLDAAPSVLW